MSHKKPRPPRNELIELYGNAGETISSLAKRYDTSNPTIRKWLIHYDIPRKSHAEASRQANRRNITSVPNKEIVEQAYQNGSIKDIERSFGVGQDTVYQWLDYHKIPLKSPAQACLDGKLRQFQSIRFTPEHIMSLHQEIGNLLVVSQRLGVSYSHVRKILRDAGIRAEPPWRSQREIEIQNMCEGLAPHLKWDICDRSIISPLELDIVCHEKRLAIEYCGSYWHSEYYGEKTKTYHQEKFRRCEDSGYTLLTFFERDSLVHIQSMLQSFLQDTERVAARKCAARPLSPSEAKIFFNNSHIWGFRPAAEHMGLFHNDVLVMGLSMGKPRFSKHYEWECIRMATKHGITVTGGASKLFSFFRNEHRPTSIVTYADLRFGRGGVYSHCGFTFQRYTPPNYWYFHPHKPDQFYSRVKFQKHKLKDVLGDRFDTALSEYENMRRAGWDRVWDCGNAVWEWRKEKAPA